MKNVIILFALFLAFTTNTKASDITEMEFDGLKVIHKKTNKKVITSSLIVKGGTANYTKALEGVESLAFQLAVEGGTSDYVKDVFHGKLEKLGSEITASSGYDYGAITLTSLKRNFNDSWNLFADAIVNPLLTEDEFDLLKTQMVTGAQQSDADPDSKLRNLAMENVFPGLPYANIAEGTASSLTDMKHADVVSHYKKVMVKNNLFLIVIGNISQGEIEAVVEKTLAKLPAGEAMAINYGAINIENSKVSIQPREIETNYVRGYMNAPDAGTNDFVAMQVAMSIVGDRMFKEIRTKRNLSYAPAAYLPSVITGRPYVVWYVTTDKPNEAIQVMFDEIKSLRTVGFSDKELKDKKAGFLTRHFMQQETGASQARTLALAELSGAGAANTDEFLNKVNALSTADINNVFKKYSDAIHWTYLGDESKVDEKVFSQEIPKIKLTKAEMKAEKKRLKKLKKQKRKKQKSKKTFSN